MSAMSSHGVILTTAMAVSGAIIYLSLSGIRNYELSTIQDQLYRSYSSNSNPSSSSSSSSLRSCLSSGENSRRREKNKKKRVKFSDHVTVQRIHNSI